MSTMDPISEEDALEEFIMENYPSECLFDSLDQTSSGTPDATSASRSVDSFGGWMRRIQGSRAGLAQGPSRYVTDWPEDESLDESYRMFNQEQLARDDASIVTSSSFLHTIKSASMSLASLSVLGRARSNTQTSSHHRSSTFSGSDPRKSIDSNHLGSTFSLDETAWSNAIQRYRIIQELLETEAAYIIMLRNLSQGLSLVLITPSGIHQCVDKLIMFHQRFLNSLQSCSSASLSTSFLARERARRNKRDTENIASQTASRRHSAFLVPKKLREPAMSRSRSQSVLAAAPKDAAEIAHTIQAHLSGFVIYKDYMAKYPIIQGEIEQLRQSKQNWQVYDQGLEALFRTVQPFSSRDKYANHARTIGDLLIQPVQRLCKYHLFLKDLMKCTPTSHCPVTHEALRQVCEEATAVTKEINSGSADLLTLDRVKKTLELQKKLAFPVLEDHCEILRKYGPMKICGVLHVAYQSGDLVTGSYMMCTLFKSHLILASASSDRISVRLMAIIDLQKSRVEEATNGIGLHCSGTPYTWKLMFTVENELMELVFSACSEKEEGEWVRNLILHATPEQNFQPEGQENAETDSIIYFNLKPLQVMVLDERLLDVSRRTSVHGAFVTLANQDCVRIHIKGTVAFPNPQQLVRPPLGRTQSLQTPRREIVLAPKRQKRIKMEKRLADIWTRDIIPYPGMPLESFMRTSTDVLMGKFTNLPQFTRRVNSSRTTGKNKSIEQFSIPTHELDKDDDEDELDSSPTKETTPGEDEDKFDLKSNTIEIHNPSTPRRAFLSLRKRHSNLMKQFTEQSSPEIRLKSSKQSLRKRLSVALLKTVSPKSRQSKSEV